jgi:hypothetical protein
LRWFATYIDPHLTLLAALLIGFFTYRFARSQNDLLERQISLDESRVPISFSFKRILEYDDQGNPQNDVLEVTRSSGQIYELFVEPKFPLLVTLGTADDKEMVWLFRLSDYLSLTQPMPIQGEMFQMGTPGNLAYLLEMLDWLSEPMRSSYLDMQYYFYGAPSVLVGYLDFDGQQIDRFYDFTMPFGNGAELDNELVQLQGTRDEWEHIEEQFPHVPSRTGQAYETIRGLSDARLSIENAVKEVESRNPA